MKKVRELVDLPDPAVQPLVHPLDIPEARRLFRFSWLVTTLTDPAVGLCVAVIVWFASRSYLVPVVAGPAHIGLGALASRYWRDQAWAFIPRKRQDRQRPLPLTWELGSSLVLATLLGVAMVLVAVWLAEPDVAYGAEGAVFSLAVGTSVLMVVGLAGELLHRRGGDLRPALRRLPVVVAVVAGTAGAWVVLSGPEPVGSWSGTVYGTLTMLMVGAVARASKQVAARASKGAARSPAD